MKYAKFLCALFGAALVCAISVNSNLANAQQPQLKRIELNENWSFRAHNPSPEIVAIVPKITQRMYAQVPGVTHTDLMLNKVINDPLYGENERKQQWIGEQEWHYETTFDPSDDFRAQQCQELVFDGLDTYAEVYLNERLLLTADNMFIQWRADLKGKLMSGPNTLTIKFFPTYARGQEIRREVAYPFLLPADNDKGSVKTSIYTRKAPFQFGWDWAPRFLSVGIWRPVYLEGWSWAKLNNVGFEQQSQSSQAANFVANINVEASRPGNVWVKIVDQHNNQYYNKQIKVQFGDNTVMAPISIKNPKLWWPNGTGEANLYPTRVIISRTNGGAPLDEFSVDLGVRTIRLVQDPDPDGQGKGFYFEVNGEQVFAKGANYIPQDVFLSRIKREDYKEFIDMCVESNFNMLRVWGGGVYQDDYFYELCDRAGIMVWQDFMFACSLYPWNQDFLDNVEKEVRYNVRRLKNHPSIAIWCGNNEITELWNHWGYQRKYSWNRNQQAEIYGGMQKLFYEHIPAILMEEDPSRYYHPSSPTHGRGNAKSQMEGDSHYWGVFHDGEPFSAYAKKTGRFNSEYGFQSMACYDTYRESLDQTDLSLHSAAMNLHQKNPKGQEIMETYMSRDLPVETSDLRKFVYLSQLLQAEGMKIAMEAHRRNRPTTMGSLYWQANDCWPAASWSSMDSRRRWKAFQFYAKKSFEPTTISVQQLDSTKIRIWGITDELLAKNGTGQISVVDFNGNILKSEQFNIQIPRNGSKMLTERNISDLLSGDQNTQVALVVMAQIDGKMHQVVHYFVPFKDLKLPVAKFDVKYEKISDTKVKATISTKVLLKNVLFEAKELQHNPSDAYFDLLPGQTKEVTLTFTKPFETPGPLGIFVTTLNSFINKGEVVIPADAKLSKKEQAEIAKKLTYAERVQLAKDNERKRCEALQEDNQLRIENIREQTAKFAQAANDDHENQLAEMKTAQIEQLDVVQDNQTEREKIKADFQKRQAKMETDLEKSIEKLQKTEAEQIAHIEKTEAEYIAQSKIDLQKELQKMAAQKVKDDEKAHKELIKYKIKAKKEREAKAAKEAEMKAKEEEKARKRAASGH